MRSVVCISHATGSGGSEIGRRVADRLGFRYVDEDIVAQAAAKGGVDPGELADEERRKSFLARVLVTASPDTRASRLSEAEKLDEASAARAVKDADAARADYLRRFHDLDEERPTQYDLVVNTDQLSVEDAAELVYAAASA